MTVLKNIIDNLRIEPGGSEKFHKAVADLKKIDRDLTKLMKNLNDPDQMDCLYTDLDDARIKMNKTLRIEND